VIFHAANDEGLPIAFGQYAAKVAVQFVAQRFVAEHRTAVFGGKHSVDEDFSE
jgi:hypothetical protein